MKLKYDEPLLSSFALNFDLRRYTTMCDARISQSTTSEIWGASVPGRGLHPFIFLLNVSAFCGIGGAFRGCLEGVFGGIRGCLGCILFQKLLRLS